MRAFVFCFIIVLLVLGPIALGAGQAAVAATPATNQSTNNQPIDISADQSLEWDQNARTYTARGNARASRGDFTIFADLLTAFDRDKADGAGTEVWKLAAEGNVRLTNAPAGGNTKNAAVAYGDQGLYDIDRQVAVLTGNNLRLESGADTVTAEDRFEYWSAKRLAVAKGEATVVRNSASGAAADRRKIIADEITTLFTENKEGELQAERSEAHGNVRIFTATDTAKGNHALYDLKRNKAIITGNVRLSRGKSQLEGDRAEVDFTTGLSRLLAADDSPKRVRGLLYPQTKDGN